MGFLSCNAETAISTCDPYIRKLNSIQSGNGNVPFRIREFSYAELESATNGFCNDSFLGKGSYGSVFKAVLDDGKLIAAVKRTTVMRCASRGVYDQSEVEIEILSRIRHRRLVNLLGFCSDSVESRLIVVEFMANGSLDDVLHSNPRPPGWRKRIRFAVQIARAIQVLHSSNPPVIHRDIKSSNILLDADCNARLGDFGLALRGHVEDVRFRCTPPAGTLGYLDPSYLAPEDLSTKSDVFSFGILLLEIITGRNAIDVNHSPPSVVDFALPLIEHCDFAGICDPRIGEPLDPTVIMQIAVLASRCVRSAAEKRPTMSEVAETLKNISQSSPVPTCYNLRRRVTRVKDPAPAVDVPEEALSNSRHQHVNRISLTRSRKVSNVPNLDNWTAQIATVGDRVGRSKSTGSVTSVRVNEIVNNYNSNNNNISLRKKHGLVVKVTPSVKLNKSRSMGVLQSTCAARDTNGSQKCVVLGPNARDLDASPLLVMLDKNQRVNS